MMDPRTMQPLLPAPISAGSAGTELPKRPAGGSSAPTVLCVDGPSGAPPPKSPEADKPAGALIDQLGDERFRKREAAAKELLARKSEVYPALQASLKTGLGAEQQQRVLSLISQMEQNPTVGWEAIKLALFKQLYESEATKRYSGAATAIAGKLTREEHAVLKSCEGQLRSSRAVLSAFLHLAKQLPEYTPAPYIAYSGKQVTKIIDMVEGARAELHGQVEDVYALAARRAGFSILRHAGGITISKREGGIDHVMALKTRESTMFIEAEHADADGSFVTLDIGKGIPTTAKNRFGLERPVAAPDGVLLDALFRCTVRPRAVFDPGHPERLSIGTEYYERSANTQAELPAHLSHPGGLELDWSALATIMLRHESSIPELSRAALPPDARGRHQRLPLPELR